jgi:hypothetical protein
MEAPSRDNSTFPQTRREHARSCRTGRCVSTHSMPSFSARRGVRSLGVLLDDKSPRADPSGAAPIAARERAVGGLCDPVQSIRECVFACVSQMLLCRSMRTRGARAETQSTTLPPHFRPCVRKPCACMKWMMHLTFTSQAPFSKAHSKRAKRACTPGVLSMRDPEHMSLSLNLGGIE